MFELLQELPAELATDGEWITLFPASGDRLAVRVKVIAIGPSTYSAAGAALASAEHPIEEFARDVKFDAFSRELCRRSIIAWEGIASSGQPAPLNLANIDRLLLDASVLRILQQEIVYPHLAREAEKNGSSPSSAGISPDRMGAKDTALDAQPAAKPALTPSPRPGRARAKRSGK